MPITPSQSGDLVASFSRFIKKVFQERHEMSSRVSTDVKALVRRLEELLSDRRVLREVLKDERYGRKLLVLMGLFKLRVALDVVEEEPA